MLLIAGCIGLVHKNHLGVSLFAHSLQRLLLQDSDHELKYLAGLYFSLFGHLHHTFRPTWGDIVSHESNASASKLFLFCICLRQKNRLDFHSLSIILSGCLASLRGIHVVHRFYYFFRRCDITNLRTLNCETTIFHFGTHTFNNGVCYVRLRLEKLIKSKMWGCFSHNVVTIWHHLLHWICELEKCFTSIFWLHSELDCDIELGENFVSCSHLHRALFLTQSVWDKTDVLKKRNIKSQARRTKTREPTECLYDTCLHCGDDLEHV